MTLLASALERAARDLRELKTSFAPVGGLAVWVRCEPRFTRDLDLAVAVSTEHEAEQLVHALVRRGYRLLAQIEPDAAKRLATVRLRPPGPAGDGGVVLDLLFASSGLEREIVAAAQPLEVFAGQVVPVATIPHLIATKVLARDDRSRPQDLVDLRQMIGSLSPADVPHVHQALARIRALGFDRGRDLEQAFRELLSA